MSHCRPSLPPYLWLEPKQKVGKGNCIIIIIKGNCIIIIVTKDIYSKGNCIIVIVTKRFSRHPGGNMPVSYQILFINQNENVKNLSFGLWVLKCKTSLVFVIVTVSSSSLPLRVVIIHHWLVSRYFVTTNISVSHPLANGKVFFADGYFQKASLTSTPQCSTFKL